jgi:MFS family permease
MLLTSVALFGVATIVFGASQSYVVSLAALLVLGAVDSISVIIRSTLLQVLTPDELRGRVAAVNAIFVNTSNEIGEFESGVTAGLFGTVRAVCAGGILTLITVGAVAAKWPTLLSLGPLDEIKPAELPSELSESPPPQ